MNPWLLAAAIFGAIGLLTEIFDDGKGAPKLLGEPKKAKKTATPVTVNVDGRVVQSPKEPKQVKKKPPVEVPVKPSDG